MFIRCGRCLLLFSTLLTAAVTPKLATAAPKAVARAADAALPLGKRLKGQALEAYTAARALFEDGDFASALVKFRAAYEAQPDPRLLWNMAVCEKNLRHYQSVKRLTQQYLEDATRERLLTPDDKREAEELVDMVNRLSSSLHLQVSEPGVTVLLDGKLVGTTPLGQPVPMDVGSHTLVLQKSGFRTQTFTREEVGGSDWVLQVQMEPQRATLQINAPADASVAVMDRVLGNGAVRQDLPPGRYLLRVTAPDKLPYDLEVTLEDQEHRAITPQLADPPRSRTWMWVLAGAGVVVGAAVGSYFLFRPTTAPIEDEGAFTVIELQQRWR